MKRLLGTRVFIALAIIIATASASAEQLARRKVFPKPSRELIAAEQHTEHAILKLVEGSGVRLRGGRLVIDPQFITERVTRSRIEAGDLPSRLAAVNAILAKNKASVTRLFSRGEKELDDYRAAGEKSTNQELGDQNLFYLLTFRAADAAMIDALDEFNTLEIVEQATPVPETTNPADKPPTTPLLTANQGYLGAAPAGINVGSTPTIPGGLGQGITITDIEYGWTPTHEDLPAPLSVQNNNGIFDYDHGTAVLGVLVGIDNAYGIQGIARAANTRLVGHYDGNASNVPNAIDTASALMSVGDIILMETQVNCFGNDLCPSEYHLGTYTAVQNAVAAGRVVVSAAGNGGNNLDDHVRFNSRFDRTQFDSGAIMVGAATSTVPHDTMWFSNYGSRIDVYAWGENVATAGYGSLFTFNNDPEQEYTAGFNGTSSASPMITGSAAVIQGVRKAQGLPLLTSTQMRAALQVGGTAQGAGGFIGVMPNVQAALAAQLPAPVITATGTASSVFISWPALSGGSYELYKRTSAGSVWNLIYSGNTPQFTDVAVSAGLTYGYKARSAGGPFSNFELATTINYTDPAITSFSTLVKAKHIIEVRQAVNAMCTFATNILCGTLPYSGNALNENFVKTQTITSADFTGVRNNIVNLRNAIGASPAVFRETTPVLAFIKRIHMEDLRTGAN